MQDKRSATSAIIPTFDERLGFLKDFAGEERLLPLRRRFEHRVDGGSGPVEAVYWPARTDDRSPPEQLTLFILGNSTGTVSDRHLVFDADGIGNPGLINYYLPFLSHLHTILPKTHAVLCTSHLGHEPHLSAPTKPVELMTLLETKVELASALRDSLDAWANGPSKRPKLVLMGHSLGGWLTCEVMKRLNTDEEAETIHAGHLLFPSLGWMAQTWNGRTMWVSLHSPIEACPESSEFFSRFSHH